MPYSAQLRSLQGCDHTDSTSRQPGGCCSRRPGGPSKLAGFFSDPMTSAAQSPAALGASSSQMGHQLILVRQCRNSSSIRKGFVELDHAGQIVRSTPQANSAPMCATAWQQSAHHNPSRSLPRISRPIQSPSCRSPRKPSRPALSCTESLVGHGPSMPLDHSLGLCVPPADCRSQTSAVPLTHLFQASLDRPLAVQQRYLAKVRAMAQCAKARSVHERPKSARHHPGRVPVSSEEVYVRRDPKNGDVILSPVPGGWQEFFAALDENRFPDDFLADRAQGTAETREDI